MPAGTRQRQQRVLQVATVAVTTAAALVLVVLVARTLPSDKSAAQRTELDSTAGLPKGWHKDRDSNGRTYYWNRKLGTSSWDPPTQKTAAPKPQPQHLHFLRQEQRNARAGDAGEQSQGEVVINADGSSRWHAETATHQRVRQPLPITVAPGGLPSGAGWDQMAVPLNQLEDNSPQEAARGSVQPRTLQALAPEQGAEGGEEAGGDDEQKVADRSHGMQMDTNPYVDKRRTFDPYAYGDPYADPATREETYPGRSNYPWDPTQDAQFYGKKGADCSDGYLRDECYERPDIKDLQAKQAVWRKKYDEFAAPGGAAAEAEEEAEEEKSDKAAMKKDGLDGALLHMQKSNKAAMKKDGLGGALLHMPEVTPWARSIQSGMLKAENSIKTGMLHASAAVKATAQEAAADAQHKQQADEFVGGEPVLASLGHVINNVKSAYQSGKGFFSQANLSELERKFLRARGRRAQQQLARNQALRAFETAALRPHKVPTTVLAAVRSPVPAAVSTKGQGAAATAKGSRRAAAHATGDTPAQPSIWESPTDVVSKGLFGGAQASQALKRGGAARKAEASRAAAAKVLASVDEGNKQQGPLPQVRAEAIKVAEEAEAGAEKLITKFSGKAQPAAWEEATLQKGVLKKQSTASNLMELVKEHDSKLLREASGLSEEDLKHAVDDAARDSHAGKTPALAPASARASKALRPWELKVAQQGTLKHESVEQNLKAALKAREKMLWKEKTGWKSLHDMKEAEDFADNLEREIKARHKEEAAHPLMPPTAKTLLRDSSPAASSRGKRGAAADAEEVTARATEAREQRELNRLREGEPLIKALQVEVSNDEMELQSEAEQQQLTLKQLHRDQTKLNSQLAQEMGGAAGAKASRKTGKAAHGGDDAEWKVATGVPQLKAVKGVEHEGTTHEYYDGLSSDRAKDDLDEYFAKEEVHTHTLHHPGHRAKSS